MATFNFGIGLSIDENTAAPAVDGLIQGLQNLGRQLDALSQQRLDFSGLTAGAMDVRADVSDLTNSMAESLDVVDVSGLNGAFYELGQSISSLATPLEHMGDGMHLMEAGLRIAGNSALRTAQNTTELLDVVERLPAALLEASAAAREQAAADEAAARVMDRLAEKAQKLADKEEALAKQRQRAGTLSGRMDVWEQNQRGVDATGKALEKSGFRRWASALTTELGKVRDGLEKLTPAGSELEESLARTGAQAGRTRSDVKSLWVTYTDAATAVSASVESQTALATSLGSTGIAFDGLGTAGQHTATVLVDSFGLSGDAVADFIGTSKRLDANFVELTDTARQFSALSGVPGLIEQLPEALDFAADANVRFAGTIRKTGAQTATDLTKTAAVFSKTFGKSAPEAMRLAQASFNTFTGAIQQGQDVMLGLADDFGPLYDAFFQTGRSIDEIDTLLTTAQTAPEEFARSVRGIVTELGEGSVASQRFLRQITRNVDPATAALVNLTDAQLDNADEVRKAMESVKPPELKEAEKQTAALDAMGASIDKLSLAMRESVLAGQQMYKNQQDLLKEQGKQATADGQIRAYQDLVGVTKGLNEALSKLGKSMDPAAVEAFTEAVHALTLTQEGLKAGTSVWDKLGSAGDVATGLWSTIRLLGMFGPTVGAAGSSIAGFASSAGTAVAGLASSVAGAVATAGSSVATSLGALSVSVTETLATTVALGSAAGVAIAGSLIAVATGVGLWGRKIGKDIDDTYKKIDEAEARRRGVEKDLDALQISRTFGADASTASADVWRGREDSRRMEEALHPGELAAMMEKFGTSMSMTIDNLEDYRTAYQEATTGIVADTSGARAQELAAEAADTARIAAWEQRNAQEDQRAQAAAATQATQFAERQAQDEAQAQTLARLGVKMEPATPEPPAAPGAVTKTPATTVARETASRRTDEEAEDRAMSLQRPAPSHTFSAAGNLSLAPEAATARVAARANQAVSTAADAAETSADRVAGTTNVTVIVSPGRAGDAATQFATQVATKLEYTATSRTEGRH